MTTDAKPANPVDEKDLPKPSIEDEAEQPEGEPIAIELPLEPGDPNGQPN